MHNFNFINVHDNVARMILRELINIRKDFKHEIQKLGDRLENCLTSSASKSTDVSSTMKASDSSLSIPGPENLHPIAVSEKNCSAKVSCSDLRKSNSKLPVSYNLSVQSKQSKTYKDSVTSLEDLETFEDTVALFPKSDLNHNTRVSLPMSSIFRVEESLLDIATSNDVPASLLNIAAYPIDSSLRPRIAMHSNDIINEKNCKKQSAKQKRKYQRPNFKSFQCEICHKAFYTNSNLKSHIETHKGLRPYPCELCDKKFARKVHLERHIRLHTGENPYTCTECGKKFSRSDNLKSHQKVHQKKRITTLTQPAFPLGDITESQEKHA